jgi:hypothetical protein
MSIYPVFGLKSALTPALSPPEEGETVSAALKAKRLDC